MANMGENRFNGFDALKSRFKPIKTQKPRSDVTLLEKSTPKARPLPDTDLLNEAVDKAWQEYTDRIWSDFKADSWEKCIIYEKQILIKSFINSPQPDYNEFPKNTKTIIDGNIEYGKFGDVKYGYGALRKDNTTKLGVNVLKWKYLFPEFVGVEPLELLANKNGQETWLCKILFTITIKLIKNISFYVNNGDIIKKREHCPIVSLEESKKAFLHEQGHNLLAAKLFPGDALEFGMSVERVFEGKGLEEVKKNATRWAGDNLVKKTIRERVYTNNTQRADEIHTKYYHDAYGEGGNPWQVEFNLECTPDEN